MSDMFAKILEENKERWAKINELTSELTNLKQTPFYNPHSTEAKLVQLVLLLVEQLRPMSATDQIENIQKEISDMLSKMSGR